MKLVFDLDETLYNEYDFVLSGYREVSKLYSKLLNVDCDEVFAFMCHTHQLTGRKGILEATYLYFAKRNLDDDLKQIVLNLYRYHNPIISIYPAAKNVLEKYAETGLALITDGDAGVQTNKIRALGVEKYFRDIHTTWTYGQDKSKPSPFCFELTARNFGVEMSDLVYVGDDPHKDFLAVNNSGGITIRVLAGKYRLTQAQGNLEATYSIDSIGMLVGLFQSNNILIA